MSAFTENPLFLFVDDLVNGNSPNFASDGKIVELFDTGCDARTPGGALKKGMEPDTANNTPDFRKPFKILENHDKTPVRKNSRLAGRSRDDQDKNIGGERKSLKQWNSPKEKFACTKSNGFAIKSAPSPVIVGKRSVAKDSAYVSGRFDITENESRAKATGRKICGTFGSREKTNPTTPSTRTLKGTSGAALNRGLKRYVNKAVDKDSLSNCSRQLEAAKTSGQASRLPRSSAAATIQPKVTPLTTKSTEIKKSEGETISDSKTPTEQPNIGNVDAPIGSKTAASRAALSRFAGRNLRNTVKPGVNGVETSKELAKVSKAVEKLSSKVQKTESVSENKSSTISRPSGYPEKVPRHPSTKCPNLTPQYSDVRNSTVSFQTRLPKPRTPLIVPKLTKFKLQDKRKSEVPRHSTESNPKPRSSVGTLNRFSDRVSKSVSLYEVQSVDGRAEEIELKTIFEDSSVTKIKSAEKLSDVLMTETTYKESKTRDPPGGSKVPRPVITNLFPVREMGRVSSAGTPIKKQNSSNPRGPLKHTVKKETKKESAKLSTPPTIIPAGNLSEAENIPEALVEVVEREEEDESVIPLMNPALCNMSSFATQYRRKSNLEKTAARGAVRGGRTESWIDGHEQAYLKGRAIGLKVASMARAAKMESKSEFIRTGPKNITPRIPISQFDKSQEIVDIGVSVIEKVLAENKSRIHSTNNVRGDRAPEYFDYHESSRWNGKQWT